MRIFLYHQTTIVLCVDVLDPAHDHFALAVKAESLVKVLPNSRVIFCQS